MQDSHDEDQNNPQDSVTITCISPMLRKPWHQLWKTYLPIFLLTSLFVLARSVQYDEPAFRLPILFALILAVSQAGFGLRSELPHAPYSTRVDDYIIARCCRQIITYKIANSSTAEHRRSDCATAN